MKFKSFSEGSCIFHPKSQLLNAEMDSSNKQLYLLHYIERPLLWVQVLYDKEDNQLIFLYVYVPICTHG